MFLIVVFSVLPVRMEAQVPGEPDELPDEEITVETNDQRTALDKTGFYLDATTGTSFRTSHLTSTQPLLDSTAVDYASHTLGVLTAAADGGVLGASVFDFEYQTPYPKTDFQREALDVPEDRRHGLEKYTFGVDTTPLWRLILPSELEAPSHSTTSRPLSWA